MSSPILSAFFLVTISFWQMCNGALTNDKYYIAQNTGDGTFLRVLSGGIPCEKIGTVGSSITLDRDSHLFRWKYFKFQDIINLLIDEVRDGSEEMPDKNEVSMDSREPSCFFAYQILRFTQAGEDDIYMISRQYDDFTTCITSNGSDQRISWRPCNNGNDRQKWKFSDA